MHDLVVVYSELFKKHAMDRTHPESPVRLNYVIEAVKELQQEKNYSIAIQEPEMIDEEILLSVHVPDHIEKIRAISASGGGMITLDTTLNEHTFDIAKLAAGATKQAAQLVDEKKAEKSFAVVRPPGHHAESNSAGGFCYFNNIAIATEWLIQYKGYNKVAIVDIDHHFGNGTSHIFYHRKDVLYVSLHAHPMYSYPGSGYAHEIGVSEGKGYNINIPLLPGTGTIDWVSSLTFALDIVNQYQPEIILVSVGFDALSGDPAGILSVNANAYFAAGYLINQLSIKHCNGKVVCVLEGGYKIDQLKEVSKKFILGLLNKKPNILGKMSEAQVTNHTASMLKQVKGALHNYWNFQ